jgi:hypothetical protein
VLHKYAAQMQAEKGASRAFGLKHLNIQDPLLPSNNLGRSVAKGSFSRIRAAFWWGAQQLEAIAALVGGGYIGVEARNMPLQLAMKVGDGGGRHMQPLYMRLSTHQHTDKHVSPLPPLTTTTTTTPAAFSTGASALCW